MKIGVGVDIEDIERFKDVLGNEKFLHRIYTDRELEYCFSKVEPEKHLAVRFSAKESVYKALCSIGREGIGLKKIEVISTATAPEIMIHDDNYGDISFSVSLSHCKDKAVAFVTAYLP